MTIKLKYLYLSILVIASNTAYANDYNQDKKNDYEQYCRYVMQKAKAQSTKLTSLDVFARVNQTEAEDKFIAAGVSKNLRDYSKSDLVLSIANSECELYKANLDASENIKYALPTLEKNALIYKLSLYKQAKSDLDILVQKIKAQVDSKNETIMTLYSIESIQQRIEASEQLTQLQSAQLQVPFMDTQPINVILQTLHTIEVADAQKQRQSSDLIKKDNWDVNVAGGVKQGILGSNNGTGLFFGVNANYNLGSNKANALLDSSDIAYSEWKINQRNSLNQQLKDLKQKLIDIQSIEQDNLAKLIEYQTKLQTLISKVDNVNSADAIKFRTQLKASQIMQDIDIKASQYKVELMANYLKQAK